MIRKALSLSIAVVALAAAAFAFLPSTASAAVSPDAAERALHAGGYAPLATDLRCVSSSVMRREAGAPTTSGATTLGLTLTDYYGSRVLILDRLCAEVTRWYSTSADNLTYGTLSALQTVMHEAQHAQGVRVEWRAECYAIPNVLAYLRRYHATPTELRLSSAYLYHGLEKYRPAAYKLRGRC